MAPSSKPAKKPSAPERGGRRNRVPPRRTSGASNEAEAEATQASSKPVKGAISSWNPSSGRGVVRLASGEVPFDVMKTAMLNKGYVDLHVGREVEVTPSDDDDEVASFKAL